MLLQGYGDVLRGQEMLKDTGSLEPTQEGPIQHLLHDLFGQVLLRGAGQGHSHSEEIRDQDQLTSSLRDGALVSDAKSRGRPLCGRKERSVSSSMGNPLCTLLGNLHPPAATDWPGGVGISSSAPLESSREGRDFQTASPLRISPQTGKMLKSYNKDKIHPTTLPRGSQQICPPPHP